MMRHVSLQKLSIAFLVVVTAAAVGRLHSGEAESRPFLSSEPRWWRGNLHTHSFWSDGDDFPEMIVAWYKDHGYHFLALSDHNVLSEGEKWIDAEKHARGAVVEALPKYRQRFGEWVEEKQIEGRPAVRLKPLNEFRAHFEEPGRFLLIQGEEITDRLDKLPVHLNATNLRDLIPPQGGTSVVEVMRNNVAAVLNQRLRTGTPMIVHLNHPNFGWGVTAEQLAQVRGERFFEVHNGHPGVRNYGDDEHPSTEEMWDIVLALRLQKPDGEILYGLATDDAHNYHRYGTEHVNPGRGWIMVRARHLTPEAIVAAMEQGDFYASTGVRLRNVDGDGTYLRLEIDAEPGIRYQTEFVGTLRSEHSPREQPELGQILAVTMDLKPQYKFTGQELYVRARVRSSKPHPNPYRAGDLEAAWTQPVVAK
jgi:hypothetical protein